MSALRHDRVRELLKRELSEILRRNFPLQENGMFSVIDVALSADLKSAKVYIGVVGTPNQRRSAQSLLRKKTSGIQQSVARNVVLKYTPRLHFILDDSVERGHRVLKIIEEIENAEQDS